MKRSRNRRTGRLSLAKRKEIIAQRAVVNPWYRYEKGKDDLGLTDGAEPQIKQLALDLRI